MSIQLLQEVMKSEDEPSAQLVAEPRYVRTKPRAKATYLENVSTLINRCKEGPTLFHLNPEPSHHPVVRIHAIIIR